MPFWRFNAIDKNLVAFIVTVFQDLQRGEL